ncbi:MAG: hypothetical protein CMJ75_00700 [Planctomycetaceae bacterium]|nr:hypothetical protein [Planctomycetaceae bacterium]
MEPGILRVALDRIPVYYGVVRDLRPLAACQLLKSHRSHRTAFPRTVVVDTQVSKSKRRVIPTHRSVTRRFFVAPRVPPVCSRGV